MKEITKEQIDEAILSAADTIIKDTSNQYLEAMEKANSSYDIDVKNNPIGREQVAIIVAQTNAINVFRNVLYDLFLE